MTQRCFVRRAYNVLNINDVWKSDLAVMRNISTYNDVKYLLLVLEVFTKFAWVEPFYNETSGSVARGMKRILVWSRNRIPRML